MATVLVVDDSGVDRNLVGGLLRKDASLQVEFAVNGADALAKLAQMPPDVVVTDLIMPEVDGLRLVATIHQQYPLTPVILMTSKGSEELATQALEQGRNQLRPQADPGQTALGHGPQRPGDRLASEGPRAPDGIDDPQRYDLRIGKRRSLDWSLGQLRAARLPAHGPLRRERRQPDRHGPGGGLGQRPLPWQPGSRRGPSRTRRCGLLGSGARVWSSPPIATGGSTFVRS